VQGVRVQRADLLFWNVETASAKLGRSRLRQRSKQYVPALTGRLASLLAPVVNAALNLINQVR
jgi:hypothetical protein